MRGPLAPSPPAVVALLGAAAFLAASCRAPQPGILPQTRLAPDVMSSASFSPGRLGRVGVLPFSEEEGVPWGRSLRGDSAEPSEVDVAERFSEAVSRLVDFEVVPPDKMASFLAPDSLEITTRRQAVDLCREAGIDAVFRGWSRMETEHASMITDGVFIPFAFLTVEVELLDGAGGETVWFAKHHINSFQFLDDTVEISRDNPASAEKQLADKIPGYPDTESTMMILAELVISELAQSFKESCEGAAR